MSKPKPVNWSIINDHELYDFTSDLLQKYHQGKNDITGVNFVLMWRHHIKVDQDGYILLADISKSADKVRELRPHDVIIGINKEAWHILEDHHKAAIIDAQLERIAVCTDKEDNPKEDDRARTVYRLRRSEVLDEATIQRRHNTTLQEIQEHVRNYFDTAGAEAGSYIANALSDDGDDVSNDDVDDTDGNGDDVDHDDDDDGIEDISINEFNDESDEEEE